jgi:hypothetical protein
MRVQSVAHLVEIRHAIPGQEKRRDRGTRHNPVIPVRVRRAFRTEGDHNLGTLSPEMRHHAADQLILIHRLQPTVRESGRLDGCDAENPRGRRELLTSQMRELLARGDRET